MTNFNNEACETRHQHCSHKSTNPLCVLLSILLSFVFFHPSSISDRPCEAAWLRYSLVPRGSGARHPHFATVPSQSLVMATLAPAVVACAHHRPLAQSLSHPIYLTQTRVSRPGPAYLSSAWFILGISSSPVPLHSGNCNKMRG